MTDHTQEAAPKRSRIPEYDLARIIAISAVILIHVTAPLMHPSVRTPLIEVLNRGVRFAVPLFVVITGALVWTSAHGGASSWSAFFKRRLSVVFVPYLAWTGVYIALGLALGAPTATSPTEFLRDLVLGTTWYHLYFVPIIVGIYLLAPAANALYRRSPALLLLVSVALGVTVPFLVREAQFRPLTLFRLIELVVGFAPYAAFGAYYAARRDQAAALLRRWWPLLLTIGLGVRIEYTFGAHLPLPPSIDALLQLAMNVLASYGVVGLAVMVTDRSPDFARKITPYAASVFGLYLAHPVALLIAEKFGALLGVWPVMPWLWIVTVWPLLTLGGLWVVRRLSIIRSLWWLHGVPPRRMPAATDDGAAELQDTASVR